MIHVESTSQGLTDKKSTFIKSLAVLTVIACFLVNFYYAVCRYLAAIGVIDVTNNWLNDFRVFVFIWMMFWIGFTFLILAIFKMIRPQVQGNEKKKEKIKTKLPTWWRIFEIGLWILIPLVIILYTLKWDAFEPLFTVGQFRLWANSPNISEFIDRLEEACLFLIFFYLTIKIPLLVGKLVTTFNRTYVGKWRIHESIIGILWFLIGCLLVLYGEFNDRIIGILYIFPGVFLIGRDYLDVMHFKIIEHVQSTDTLLTEQLESSNKIENNLDESLKNNDG
jgi:hypothetical protein